jgi:hypothetical protein
MLLKKLNPKKIQLMKIGILKMGGNAKYSLPPNLPDKYEEPVVPCC